MFALFALIVIASAEYVTQTNVLNTFYMYEVDECYVASSSTSYKVTKDSSYVKTSYSNTECTGTGSTETASLSEGKTDYAFGYFSGCTLAKDNEYVDYLYQSGECLSSSGSGSYKYEVKDDKIYEVAYTSVDCGGDGSEVEFHDCDSCVGDVYYTCSASLTSIIFVVLATIFILF
ncbi:hypothetical protein QTN25_000142 [Entamoeba marina]